MVVFGNYEGCDDYNMIQCYSMPHADLCIFSKVDYMQRTWEVIRIGVEGFKLVKRWTTSIVGDHRS
jgi:hypothetical protein